MRFKRLALVALTGAALSVIMASAAQAAPHWKVGGAELSGSETISFAGGPWTLSGKPLGVAVEIDGGAVQCGGLCQIFGSAQIALGHLTVTAAKVTKPANCTVSNPGSATGSFEFNPLKGGVIMDPENSSGPVFAKLAPETGSKLAELEFHGALCPLDELAVSLEGSFAGQFSSVTAFEAVEQPLAFGSTQQTTSGSAMKLGSNAAVATGSATVKLSGAKAGKAFAPTE
jgi:hypothetical protein